MAMVAAMVVAMDVAGGVLCLGRWRRIRSVRGRIEILGTQAHLLALYVLLAARLLHMAIGPTLVTSNRALSTAWFRIGNDSKVGNVKLIGIVDFVTHFMRCIRGYEGF